VNCNHYSSLLLDRDYDTPRCNRARLDTGTFCNYDCEFCYYQGLLHLKTDLDTIKTRVDKLHQYGISEIDLSGGESSVHKDWFEILNYCSTRFDHISTLSNGWAFANEQFLVKSKKFGLKEILFSVHGYDQQSHDEIVRRKGAWDRINRAIEHAHKHGIVVRVNCTVYQKNIDGLLSYHHVLKRLNPIEVNFLTLNYWTNNEHADPIDYKTATDNIKSCIDKIKPHVKYVNVRYTPYCYMTGYERHVCNQFQHIYDRYDWNKEIYGYDIDVTKQYTDEEKIDMAYAAAERQRNNTYTKPSECLKCKYYNICDGVEKQVTEFEVKPVPGDKITDVNFYRHGFYDGQHT
jgi:MoaA/NifB/PqqE/SkfB family radical SAM enzyme